MRDSSIRRPESGNAINAHYTGDSPTPPMHRAMNTTTLLLYVIAVSAVTVMPGPTMLLALNNGATRGMRIAAYGIAGAALSDLILIGAVGCGLGAIMQASEQLFAVLKWVGAAYLLYLAWALWRAPASVPSNQASQSANEARDGLSAFKRSLLVALSNPKGLLFFSAFLPQFIQPETSVAAQYATLAAVTAAIDALLMTVYAACGYHVMKAMSERVMKWLNRGCAGMLAGLAVALSLYRRGSAT